MKKSKKRFANYNKKKKTIKISHVQNEGDQNPKINEVA